MREFIKIINESFQSSLPITWEKDPDGWYGEFSYDELNFRIVVSEQDKDYWLYEFYGSLERNNGFANAVEPTNTGNTFIVYSTLFHSIKDFLTEKNPGILEIHGHTPKQSNLYKKMVLHYKSLLQSMGYHIKIVILDDGGAGGSYYAGKEAIQMCKDTIK